MTRMCTEKGFFKNLASNILYDEFEQIYSEIL